MRLYFTILELEYIIYPPVQPISNNLSKPRTGKKISIATTFIFFKIFKSSVFEHVTAPCESPQNGGCSQLCVPSAAGGRVCRCGQGYRLQADGTTCLTDTGT